MKNYSIIFFIICTLILLGPISTTQAKVVASPPVKVNVVGGTTISDEKINDMFKDANKILDQANVSLDADPNVSRNVSDEGNGDDNIDVGEDANLDEKGQEEINKKFGKGIGLKVYITDQIHGDDDILGCAPHVTEDANGNLEGKPIIYIKNDPCSPLGTILAHEACHVFTLGDKDIIDINDSLKFEYCDDDGHVNDNNNLMDPTPTEDSNKLTTFQRTEVFVGAARHCKKVKVVKVENNVAPKIVTMPSMRGGWVDDMGEVPQEYIDLGAGFFYAEHPLSNMEISILTEGLYPPVIVDIMYSMYLNTDGNPLTGTDYPAFGLLGIDRMISIHIGGEHPGGDVTAYIQNNISGITTFLPIASTQRIKKIFDSEAGPYSEPYVDGIYLEVPMELLGEIGSVMDGLVTAEDMMSPSVDTVPILWEDTTATDPALELVTTQIEPGEPIQLSGQNYTPTTEVTIYVDDEPIGTTMTDPSGNFYGTFFFDPGSDPFDGGVPADAVVRGKDSEGKSDFSILEIQPFDGDINLDLDVNFKDLAEMGKNWLIGI